MVVQAHRVAFSLGRKMQDAACELVGPQCRQKISCNPKRQEHHQDRERGSRDQSCARIDGRHSLLNRSKLALSLPGVDPEWHGIVYEAPLYGARGALIFCNAMTNDQPSYIGTPAMEIAEMVFLHLAAA